jgi:hypothetical protein
VQTDRGRDPDKAEFLHAGRRLEAQDGRNIPKCGTGTLDAQLLEHKLVDEYHFWL